MPAAMLRAAGVKKRKARPEKRRLVRWNNDLNNQLLLSIQSACNHSGVKIPWDEVGKFMTDPKHGGPVAEGAIVQHLAKMRGQLVREGQPVPKPLKRGGQQRPNLDSQANSINVTENTALGVHIHHTDPDITGVRETSGIKKEEAIDNEYLNDGDSSGDYGKPDTGRIKLPRQAKDKAKKVLDKEESDDELMFKFEEAYLNGKKSTNMEDGGRNRVASNLDGEPDYKDLPDDESVLESETGSNYPIADDGYVLVPAGVGGNLFADSLSSSVSSGPSFVCADAAFLPRDDDLPEVELSPSLMATLGWGKNLSTYLTGFNNLKHGGVIDQDTLPPPKYMMMSGSPMDDFVPNFTAYNMPTIHGDEPNIAEADHESDFFAADDSNHFAKIPTNRFHASSLLSAGLHANEPQVPEADRGSDFLPADSSNLTAEPEEQDTRFDMGAAMNSNEWYGTMGEWIGARWWHDYAIAQALGAHHTPTANDHAGFVHNPQTGVWESPTFDQDFTIDADHNVGDYHPFTKKMELQDWQFP